MIQPNQLRSILPAVLLATILSGCASPPPAPEQPVHFTILHTNDHHGRFWKNRHGEYGMAARKTLIDDIREEVNAAGGTVLLLSGGDINTGVPQSDLLDAEPDFKAMNMLGYDAMAIGNHEFDNPTDVIAKQNRWTGFPFLSANIFKKGSKEPAYLPYKIFTINGLKIAVIGFTTADTAKIGNPEFTQHLEFRDPSRVAKKLVRQLRKEASVIIALTHMGHYADGNHGSNAPGDVTLARDVDGIDAIIGGHSQKPLFRPDVQNGTYIVQAYEWGKYVGRMDLVYANGELQLDHYRLIPVNLKRKVNIDGESKRLLVGDEITEDEKMLKFLEPYQKLGQALLSEVIGTTNGLLQGDRKVVRNNETSLGNLIAESQRQKVGADVAIMNSGGIRTSIEAGDITYENVLKVQPFTNQVGLLRLTGAELRDYLTVVAGMSKGSGAFPQYRGIKLFMKDNKIDHVMINGKPLDATADYSLAINSFIAAGGDGYPRVSDSPNYTDTGYVDAEVLKDFINNNSPIDPKKYAPEGDVETR